jgi:hypothetical protein
MSWRSTPDGRHYKTPDTSSAFYRDYEKIKAFDSRYGKSYSPEQRVVTITRMILKLMRMPKTNISIMNFHPNNNDVIAFGDVKTDSIVFNRTHINKLEKFDALFQLTIHEIGHLKGIAHEETGLMRPFW